MSSFSSRLLALLLALLPGLALGQAPAPAGTAAPAAGSTAFLFKPGQHIVFLGDSTTISGWTNASGFVHLVALGLAKENVQVTANAFGAPRMLSKDVLNLYQTKVAPLTPKADWLVISCGLDEANTGLPGTDPASFQQDMKTLVDEAKAAGMQVMIMTTGIMDEKGGPTDQKLAPYNDALRALAKSENCPLADVNAALKAAVAATPPVEGFDRFLQHGPDLNSHGHRVVAAEILKTVGLSDAQLAEVKEAWLDTPRSASTGLILLQFVGTAPITLGQYNQLEKQRMDQHQSIQTPMNKIYIADWIAALRAGDASSDFTSIQNAAQASFQKDVTDVLKNLPPTTPASTPASTPATGNIIVKSGQKVAFLGDSITQFGWQHPDGYVKLVVSGLDAVGVKIEPIPAGVSGNTSRDMIARLKGSVLAKKPDWMTLSCGVNDVWHGAAGCDLETYKKNITSILDQVQQANIKPVILTSTMIQESDNPLNQKLAAYNDFLREQAKERKLPLADLNELMHETLKAGGPSKHITVDGVHMNPAGNQMMASGVLKAFGLSDAQLAQAQAHWYDAPNGASIIGAAAVSGSAVITLRESDELERQAQANKLTLVAYLTPMYIQALVDTVKADPKLADQGPIGGAVQTAFDQKVADLLKNPPPATAPPAATGTPAPPATGK